jgi:hypothetical protein
MKFGASFWIIAVWTPSPWCAFSSGGMVSIEYHREGNQHGWRVQVVEPTDCQMSKPNMKASGTEPRPKAEQAPEEQEVISAIEKSRGRSLTEQEINFALEQARAIGEL